MDIFDFVILHGYLPKDFIYYKFQPNPQEKPFILMLCNN